MAHFLAMADLERARVCSFGLTKTFFNFNQFPQLRNLNYITYKRVVSVFLPTWEELQSLVQRLNIRWLLF